MTLGKDYPAMQANHIWKEVQAVLNVMHLHPTYVLLGLNLSTYSLISIGLALSEVLT